jgi:L-fuculose-phosphate aldolase
MFEQQIREQICEIGRRIYARGMVAANDGNISVKINENEYLCTPTGISKGFMTPECICKIDENGNVIEAQDGYRPSSEMKMHMRVYKRRTDVTAVVHAHPAYATTFAIEGIPLNKPIMSEAVVTLGCVPVAEYGLPSTSEIPDALEPYLPYFDSVLLEHHGALTWASNLTDAYYRMESVELYAELIYRTMQIGKGRELDSKTVTRLCQLREDAGMRNPQSVCLNQKLQFKSCEHCSRYWKNLINV